MFFTTLPTTIDQFRANIVVKGGFQAQSRYYIQITPPLALGGQSIVAYPEAIQFPEKNITVITDELFTMPRRIPVSSDMGDILLSFIIYQDWKERKFFETWMDRILNHPIGSRHPGVRAYYSSVGAMNIVFTGNNNLPNHTYSFTEVMPNSLSPIAFDADSFGRISFQVLLSARSDRFSGY